MGEAQQGRVTKVGGPHSVDEIDGRPALDVFLEWGAGVTAKRLDPA